MLKLDNVSFTYYTKTEETAALTGVSFDVEEGEFVAVLGPSGCGKTTLLSLVCGLLKPTDGMISINGTPVSKVNRTDIGYMLQRDHLFEWRTVYKNIILGLEIQHKLDSEHLGYVDLLLDKYGLAAFKSHKPDELSGGMRQRAALIRTLALNPKLLLLDEPFSALDYQTRLNVCDDVYSIIKIENKTALLVTHDISEAISLADKIIVLSDRPATVKRTLYPKLGHIKTPLKRREAPTFSEMFDAIWSELNAAPQLERMDDAKKL
ncbi:MAG: ABC transporter ATP-binding protein [Clostridia bacterium]|nr:ABC transporter ATP-binding protein [Clostridia bacterium]